MSAKLPTYTPLGLYPDPQTLYDPDPLLKPMFMREYWAPIGGFISGMATHAVSNFLRGRPLRTAIYLYPVYAGGCTFGFWAIHQYLKSYYSRRDTIHKHYVQLHPEDFPPPPKVKIGELLESWNPTR